jgi:hypothetical protein
MYRNWVEMRAYMLDRQKELMRLAELSRQQASPKHGGASSALRKIFQRPVTRPVTMPPAHMKHTEGC